MTDAGPGDLLAQYRAQQAQGAPGDLLAQYRAQQAAADPLAALHPEVPTAAQLARANAPIAEGPIPSARLRAPSDVTQTPMTSDRGPGTPVRGVTGRVLKNLVNPMLEQPLQSAALSAAWPVGLALSGLGMAQNLGGYAGQKAAELTADPATRKVMLADPDRIQGADVATQLAGLALPLLAHTAVRAAIPDVGPAVPQAFADIARESKGTVPVPDAVRNALFEARIKQARDQYDAEQQVAQQTAAGRSFADVTRPLTAQEARAVARTTAPVEGLETPETSVADIASQKIADQVAQQAKAEADAARVQAENEAKAKADYEAALGSRTPLGVERGIVRRPGGQVPEGAPPIPEPAGASPPAPEAPEPGPPPPLEALKGAYEKALQDWTEAFAYEPERIGETEDALRQARDTYERASALPRYPEGFAMGGPESRIPADVPKVPRGNPEVPSQFIFTHTEREPRGPLADFPGAEGMDIPVGTPKGLGPSELVNPRTLGTAVTAHPSLFDTEMKRLSDAGLDKTLVPFPAQQKVAQAFADAIGLDRLQLNRKALGRMTGAEIVGLKQKFSQNMDALEPLSQALASGTLDAKDVPVVQQKIAAIQAQNADLLHGIVHGSADVGRSLGFLRQVAHRTLDPDVWVVQAQRLAGETPLSDQAIATIRKLARDAMEACA